MCREKNIRVYVGLLMTHDPSSMKEGLVLSLGGFCFVQDTLFLNLMFVMRIPFQLLVSLVNFSVARSNIEPPSYKNDSNPNDVKITLVLYLSHFCAPEKQR